MSTDETVSHPLWFQGVCKWPKETRVSFSNRVLCFFYALGGPFTSTLIKNIYIYIFIYIYIYIFSSLRGCWKYTFACLLACIQLKILKRRAVGMSICFTTVPVAPFLLLLRPVTALWDVCKLHENFRYTLCTGFLFRVSAGGIKIWRLIGSFRLPPYAYASAEPVP